MGLRHSALRSSHKPRVISTGDSYMVIGNVIGLTTGRVSDVSEVVDQETTSISAIKTEPNVQTASALRRNDVCSKTSVMACEPVSLNDLPDKILLKILSFFGPEDLCFIIARVCEKWNVLAKDVTQWKTLCYEFDDHSDISRIEEVLTNATALHSLTIRRRKDVANILKFLCHIRGDLRELNLQNCSLGEDSTGLLADIVALYPDLEILSLYCCSPLTSAGYCLIAHLKKLSVLNLTDYEGLSGETVRLIADGCQLLKKLSLFGVCWTNDDDIIHVIKQLGKQLTTLALDGRGPGLTDVAYSYLKNCARLQKLELSFFSGMTDRGLMEGIGSLQELTSLSLDRGCSVTAKTLSIFLNRPSMTSMVLLSLWDCPMLDDEGLKGIAKRCKYLKDLAVGYCSHVTDAGISMVIRHCNQLRVLRLMGLKYVTGEGYMALVPSYLPHLRLLDVQYCSSACYKNVEELAAALPEMIPIYDYCYPVHRVINKPVKHLKVSHSRFGWFHRALHLVRSNRRP